MHTLKYLDYREKKLQGTFDFPIAFYHVESNHPRYQMPYHWHPEYEIIRILQGKFQVTVDGNTVQAAKEDILVIQGGTLHGGIPEDCIYECIVFDMGLLLSNNKHCNKLIKQLTRQEIVINQKLNGADAPLHNAVDALFTAMRDKKPGYEFHVQAALYGLLGICVETQAYCNNNGTSTVTQQINRFKDVINYIEDHYSENITLEAMAQIAGLSSRYFCRFFRKMTRYTPMEYLNYYRIECACEHLAEIKPSVTEVALNCGFNDISYFIKSFHKAKGVTPRQYKESSRQM